MTKTSLSEIALADQNLGRMKRIASVALLMRKLGVTTRTNPMRLDKGIDYTVLFSWIGIFSLGTSFYIAIGYCI